jgi:GNAT superfamily N-acetyltransferase
MQLEWIHESAAQWDESKARIIRAAPPGTFGVDRFARLREGDLLPGDWWRVDRGGEIVAYGWMDSTWGDAEILLAVAPSARRQGVGTFVLDHLEAEAAARGFNYLYNVVSRAHPDADGITAWLAKNAFHTFEDGSLRRRVGGHVAR